MSIKALRVAIIGCGAVTEQRHLPALSRRNDCSLVALVDQNRARAKALARQVGNPEVLADVHNLLRMEIDVAIVAVPNHLHAAVSTELLRAGIHVLVEKPIALSVAECDEMLRAAAETNVVLAVGMMRRFIHASRFVKWAIDNNFIGRIRSIDIRDGYAYSWPITTDFPFRKETAGGGVLMDTGVHTLDQLLWWLGEPLHWKYYDDSAGGVESESLLHVTFLLGAKGTVELSRNRTLRNTAQFYGERGEMEVSLLHNTLWLRPIGAPVQVIGTGTPTGGRVATPQSQVDIVQAEHDDFLNAVRTGHSPEVTGADARCSIDWIQACYRERQRLRLGWTTVLPEESV
jgi:predicted dehydrogenase